MSSSGYTDAELECWRKHYVDKDSESIINMCKEAGFGIDDIEGIVREALQELMKEDMRHGL